MLIILIPLLWKLPWLLCLYFPIYWLLKYFRPTRSYVVPTAKINTIILPSDDEWNLEKVHDQEIITIDGSTQEGDFVYIQVLTKNSQHEAYVTVAENEEIYTGRFNGLAKIGDNTIHCGPLTLELRSPFRRWRITFRGYLKDSNGHAHFVSIGGWWKSLSNARFFYSNAGLKPFLNLIRRNKLSFLKNMKVVERFRLANVIDQLGFIHVELKIDDTVREVKYRGVRERAPLDFFESVDQFTTFFNDGNALSHKIASFEHHTTDVNHGLFFKANHKVKAIQLKTTSSLDETNLLPIDFEVRSENPYEVRKDNLLRKFSFVRSDNKIVDVTVIQVVNALSKGVGFIVRTRETTQQIEHLPLEEFPVYNASKSEKKLFVLPFSHRACQDKTLTGGKGSNLSRLQSITNQYRVPPGVVVTTTAFDAHVQQNSSLANLITKLDNPKNSNNFYVEIGLEIEKQLRDSNVSQELEKHILQELPESEYYAVRSSAVGEDGADLSSAGQLESFLDVTKENIVEKLKLCWASNFRREVINYRRNYGQQLNPSMAVVIQEMSRDGVAGVLFTADPVRNDTGRLLINALKGCGEQIVSGQETPDEIFVHRIFGDVVLPEGGCCLSRDEVDKLVMVGTHLESVFGKPQDVEFVVRDGQVFVVQSRDITGLDKESYFELYYEFDTPEFTDKEILSNANVGEVMPAPMVPLECAVTSTCYDKAITAISINEIDDCIPIQYSMGFSIHHRKVFFNLGEMVLRSWQHIKKDRIMDIVFAGEELFYPEMFDQAEHRFGYTSALFPVFRMIKMIQMIFYTSYKLLESARAKSEQMQQLIPNPDADIDFLFRIHEQQLKLHLDIIGNHAEISMVSSFTYVIVGMLIRGSDEGSLSPEDISDFANVFSNNSRSDVISADVPSSLKKIARAIKTNNLTDDFGKVDGEEALKVLEKSKETSELLKDFMTKHGHRGPNELYMNAKTWSEDADLLAHTLKCMLSCPEANEKVVEDPDNIINTLKCKPKGLRKTLLKYFIGQTHRGVAYRETAKNYLVKGTQINRTVLRTIARKLFEKGYLPEMSLWLHFTYDELKELYATRSAKLVSRATRRKQIFEKFEGLQFPILCHGPMNPINTEVAKNTISTSVSLRGTTVCEGKVIARARVAKTLDEAKHTEPGEVLITRYTDICWSPFFPIISGIVTEIGGLLSHGAVVAREYGLPSLIAVQNATNIFKTGDLVELDAMKGTISRIEEEL